MSCLTRLYCFGFAVSLVPFGSSRRHRQAHWLRWKRSTFEKMSIQTVSRKGTRKENKGGVGAEDFDCDWLEKPGDNSESGRSKYSVILSRFRSAPRILTIYKSKDNILFPWRR
jgi:hypothetical protein